ncbi:MAG: cytochrome c [Verrucomicrobiae bacterium]|nr:cytochrome c [Verrucomicrobiae bacterium]
MTTRAFWALVVTVASVVVAVAGLRGTVSQRRPIELVSDMVRQLRLRPQQEFDFFGDGLASRLWPSGVVARDGPDPNDPIFTGRVRHATNFLETIPMPVTRQLLQRGRERFTIYCAPCHGMQGDGKGITTRLGLTVVANLHDPRIVRMLDGELFNTLGHGKGLMQGYAASIVPTDRWAIVAFLRALQLSHLGLLEDVPEDHRAELGQPE